MNKKQLLQKCWIPFTKRLPPAEKGLIVIAWNYMYKQPWVRDSLTLRREAEQLIKDPNCFKGSPNAAIHNSHWMKIPEPTN